MAENTMREHHRCPYCDDDIAEAAFPYCEACGLEVLTCPKCGISVARDSERCPGCGVDLKEAVNKEP